MKKAISGCFTAIGVIVVLLVVFALGCGNSGDKAKETGKDEATQVETKADDEKDEKEEQEQKAEVEDKGKKSDTSDEKSEKPAKENKTDLSDDYIRPEFQEFCDAYVAFYREYADYMKQYNEDPTNAELMSGLAGMMQREADMVEASDGWEAEDLTPAEEALYTKTLAEALRINAEILENSN